jgi:hypothetical protein
MINIYLNQVEKELDQLLVLQKSTNDYLRIAEDIYSVIEPTENHEALKTIALFNVIKRQAELTAIESNIELAHKTIKDLHNVRRTQRKERSIEQRTEDFE